MEVVEKDSHTQKDAVYRSKLRKLIKYIVC